MGIADDIRPHKDHKSVADKPDFTQIGKDDLDDIVEPEDIKNAKADDQQAHNDDNIIAEKNAAFFKPEKTKPKKITPANKPKEKKKPNYLLILLILMVLALLGIAAFQNLDYIKTNILKINSKSASSTTVKEIDLSKSSSDTSKATTSGGTTQTTTPDTSTQPVVQPVTPPVIDKASFTIRVSNGNGIANSAAKVAGTLKTAGFNVVSQGNASSYTYRTTIVYYKAGMEQQAEMVKSALSARSVTTQLSATLTSYDVMVIVGKT